MSGVGHAGGGDGVLHLLLRLYPVDFRDEMGGDWLATYREGLAAARRSGGRRAEAGLWLRAVLDSLRNGAGERLRPAVTWRRRGDWGRDVERVVRRLLRSPVFTLAVLATLAVGLGAFGIAYGAAEGVLLEPPAFERPGDLYWVWRDYSWVDFPRGWLAGSDVAALQAAGGPIAGAAAVRREAMTLGGDGTAEPEEVAVMVSSADLLRLLGAEPAIGRGFATGEDRPDRAPVLVLGHDLWARRFAADPSVLGREVRLDGETFTVVGVMGRDFRFARHSSLGAPETAEAYATHARDLAADDPHTGAYGGLLRARAGASPEVVADAVAAVGRAIDERDFEGQGLRLYPVGLLEDLVAPVRPALLVLALAGGSLVLVLAANLGSLLLGRAAQRERELAVARALGANRLAVARATVLEGAALGVLGGAAGVALAAWGLRLLATLAPEDLPRRAEIGVDGSVALVVVATGLALGVVAGAVPAAWAACTPLARLLGNAGVRGGGGHGRLRRGLVVSQVALSLVLLAGAGLLARSLDNLFRADPGFRPDGVLTVRVPLAPGAYPDPAAAVAFQRRLVAELAALPGVVAVGGTSALPLSAGADQSDFSFPGAPGNTGDPAVDEPLLDYFGATPGVFAALGVRLVAGRTFSEAPPPGVQEVLIDERVAQQFFPSASPLGHEIVTGDDHLRIVGVVRQPRLYDVHRDGRGQLWARNDDIGYSSLYYALRTEGDPLDLVPAVRSAVRRLDPALPLADLRPLAELVEQAVRQQRLSAALVGGFAVGALLLAAMGLFGLVAGAVTRRRHELGVRLALGAGRRRVVRLVVADGLGLVALGVLLGVPGVWALGRFLDGVVVDISPFDPATLAAVAAGLGLVAAVACWLPARRVAAIDPASSLRAE